jgi:hypothetical protein
MTTRSRLFHLSYFCLLLTTLPAWAATKRAGGDALDLPEPVKRPVKYFGDIHPVLAEHCVSCHGPDKQKGGLPLDDQLHADHLRDMLTMAFSHPQMTGFVIWGFWETRHWKPTAAMFKADWTERPAVKVWRDLVKTKWWTTADLVTDAKGEAPLSAYYGWYDITVEHDGKTKTFEVKHATNGGKPTLKLE